MSNYSNFQQENDHVLSTIIQKRFYDEWETKKDERTELELYITSDCNLKCEYCYLKRFGDKLYPQEIRNEEAVLKNISILCNHLIKKNAVPYKVEIFSGEIWGTEFGYQVLQKLLESIENGFNTSFVMIPSNMSFILSDKQTEKIQYYINRYKIAGVRLSFSASLDGLFLEEQQRSFKDSAKNQLRNQDFYDKVFMFCKKNSFGFHPMVSAYGIEKWIDNYNWYKQMLFKYKLDISRFIMFLEVRNNDWTQEKIEKYLDFLNYMIDDLYNNFYQSKEEMARDVFRIGQNVINNYNPAVLSCVNDQAMCTITNCLFIRMGDLAIVPCHRTCYDKFIYGHYEVENDEIIGIKSHNLPLATLILLGNQKLTLLGCDSCVYNNLCPKGCYGAQLEEMKEINIPCDTCCSFFKQRIDFLIKKYKELGLLDILLENSQGKNKNQNISLKRCSEVWHCIKDTEQKILEEKKQCMN